VKSLAHQKQTHVALKQSNCDEGDSFNIRSEAGMVDTNKELDGASGWTMGKWKTSVSSIAIMTAFL
jgi:hypothetical protein